MVKEFNLSEKRKQLEGFMKDIGMSFSDMTRVLQIIESQDKEFIKKLKDSMATFSANRSNGMQILNHFWKEIDKLSGERLK